MRPPRRSIRRSDAIAPAIALLLATAGSARADHDHAAMSDAAMREAMADWFRMHPEHGRDLAPGTVLGAPADTFRATSSPSFRFDTDGNLSTTQDSVTIFVGESILWLLVNGAHTVTSGIPGQPGNGTLFNVSLDALHTTFTFTYPNEGRFPFFCSPHSSTMRGVVKVQSLVGVEPLPLPDGAAASGFLARPAPNPAREFVIARFALARAGRARLDVLDARGRRVARPVDGAFEAGGYAVKWERKEEGGGRAPAGVYFLRLTVPGATRNERVTLVD